VGTAAISRHSITSTQRVRSKREQSGPLLVVLVAMVCGYIPMHKTTFIEACKVSRFMPRRVSTNVRMA
jgi:hypothetical protein